MFERFTDKARQVIVLAQSEARALRHTYIGTEHLLLGLLSEREGLAARVLGELEITLEGSRERVTVIVGEGDEVASGQIPFTPRAKKVLELALREALSLGHNYIGTEHILLGLVRENEGVATRILLDFGVDAETIRNKVIRVLSGPGRRGQPELHRSPGTIGASPRPRGWEYRVESFATAELTGSPPERLNRLGAEGWQLAGTIPTGDRVELIFQRPELYRGAQAPVAPPGPSMVESGLTIEELAASISVPVGLVIRAVSGSGDLKAGGHRLTDDEIDLVAAKLDRVITIAHDPDD